MSKNILFIGPIGQSDGWGLASKNYLRALELTKHNIVARPIYMSRAIEDDSQFNHLQNKYFNKNPDVIIQNVLPHLMDFQYGSKNIGLCHLESCNLYPSGWISHINLMDEIWVSTSYAATNLKKDGVAIPIKVVHTPIDTSSLDIETPEFYLPSNDYIFYFIGALTTRKNLESLIVAFHREFHFSEQVSLLVKTNKMGYNEESLIKLLSNSIKQIKEKLRLYYKGEFYHEELLNVTRLSQEELTSLHKRCNCFVMPSFGEGLCLPLMDAMYLNSDIIVTNDAGMNDVVPNDWKIPSIPVPCVTSEPPLPNLYTGHETWKSINIIELQKSMRQAFNNTDLTRTLANKKHINQNFSIDSIAKKIEEIL